MYAHHACRRGVRSLGIALVVPLALATPSGASPATRSVSGVLPDTVRATAPTLALAGGPQPFLSGLTSQDMPVLLRFSADRRILTRVVTTLRFTCTSGARSWSPDGFGNITVTSLRHFRVAFSPSPSTTADGTTSMRFSEVLDGRLDRTGTRVSATWQATEVDSAVATGAVTDTCTTGVVRISAHRQ